MSQTDPRAVAREDIAEQAYWDFDARRKGYSVWTGQPQSERDAFKAEFRNALADAERRGLERAAKVAEQMKIQTCAIRNETAIIHELLLKVESRIEKVATLEKQIRAQAQADKEG